MSQYERGAAFEREILKWWDDFNKEGEPKTHWGIRSAGSKGPIDLMLWDETTLYLIQAKRGAITKPELERALEGLRAVPFPELVGPLKFGTHVRGCETYEVSKAHREVWVRMGKDDWARHEA